MNILLIKNETMMLALVESLYKHHALGVIIFIEISQ